MQLSPCHAGLAEQQFQRLLSVLGFVGRLLFPRPFEFRLAADPRMSSESFPSAMGMLHELLRRTGRWGDHFRGRLQIRIHHLGMCHTWGHDVNPDALLRIVNRGGLG